LAAILDQGEKEETKSSGTSWKTAVASRIAAFIGEDPKRQEDALVASSSAWVGAGGSLGLVRKIVAGFCILSGGSDGGFVIQEAPEVMNMDVDPTTAISGVSFVGAVRYTFSESSTDTSCFDIVSTFRRHTTFQLLLSWQISLLLLTSTVSHQQPPTTRNFRHACGFWVLL
jgi:hypothetical protein